MLVVNKEGPSCVFLLSSRSRGEEPPARVNMGQRVHGWSPRRTLKHDWVVIQRWLRLAMHLSDLTALQQKRGDDVDLDLNTANEDNRSPTMVIDHDGGGVNHFACH